MKKFKFLLWPFFLFLFVSTGIYAGGSVEKVRVSYPVENFKPVNRSPIKAPKGQSVEINIFSTNDEHGWIFDWDYGLEEPKTYKGKPDPAGLARISTLYKEKVKEYPNAMLVSAGDTIQGTLLSYYYNFVDPEKVNPATMVFKLMGYEAWTVGNHEVEQGNGVMLKVAGEMAENNVAVLSANAVREDNPEMPYYLPYLVKEIDGVRVGILGLTTPGIPMWLADETHEGHRFQDMVEAARKWVPVLREKEKVDVLIGLFHAGMNEDYDQVKAAAFGLPAPNASALVARAIGSGPGGIDAIITGHSHKLTNDTVNTEYRDSDNNVVNGVKFLQAGSWGLNLGHLSVKVSEKEGRWVVEEITCQTYSVNGCEEDPSILKAMDEYFSGARKYASTAVGTATEDLDFSLSMYEESAIVDLIHETQVHFTGADISIAASFGSDGVIPKGEITVGSIARIYIYENFLNVIKLTGQQVKDYLEYSSNYYSVLNSENLEIVPLVNPDVQGYNYDMAQGFNYEIDLTRPVGQRIVNMKNSDGSPFDLEKTYTVALNSYRYNGGGGHLTACGAMEKGLLKAETVYSSSMAMRDLMVEYIRTAGDWGPEDIEYNWKLVPEELAREAVKRQVERDNTH